MVEHPNYDHICNETFTVGSSMFQVRRSTAKGDENRTQPPYVVWQWDTYQERWIGAGTFLDAEVSAAYEDRQVALHSFRAQIFDQIVVFSEESQP